MQLQHAEEGFTLGEHATKAEYAARARDIMPFVLQFSSKPRSMCLHVQGKTLRNMLAAQTGNLNEERSMHQHALQLFWCASS